MKPYHSRDRKQNRQIVVGLAETTSAAMPCYYCRTAWFEACDPEMHEEDLIAFLRSLEANEPCGT